MRLKVKAGFEEVKRIIVQSFDDYNIIHQSRVTNDTYFIVLEKYFFRTSNRASLSIVVSENEYGDAIVEAIGSGGGQGMFFKFDWGVKGSFENKIRRILDENHLTYQEIN